MNKQEVISKLKSAIPKNNIDDYQRGEAAGLNFALLLLAELNEIKKTAVPRYVANFYESIKDDFEGGVYELCTQFYEDEAQLSDELHDWFVSSKNKPIETLVMMHKFGYEVEKEKRYTAKLKLTDEYLCCESQFKDLLHYKVPDSSAKEVKAYHFTEDDLVKYHIWGNDNYEVKKVEE